MNFASAYVYASASASPFGAPPPPSFGGGAVVYTPAPFIAPVSGRPAVPAPPAASPKQAEVDSNIISVALGTIGSRAEEEVETGDPHFCESCGAAVNGVSDIRFPADPGEAVDGAWLQNKSEEFRKRYVDLQEGEALWQCEFCGCVQAMLMDFGEVPKKCVLTMDYMLEPPPEVQESEKKTNSGDAGFSVDKGLDNKRSIIFCIDISGSMANKCGATTRMRAVVSALSSELESLVEKSPTVKVGIITFDDAVHIYSENKDAPPTKAKTGFFKGVLNQQVELANKARTLSLQIPLVDSKPHLQKTLTSLKPQGRTALGPALVCALAMLEGSPGSSVIVCTDGLANVGVGSIKENSNVGMDWYEQIGELAKSQGTSVSVISVVDKGCRLDFLGAVSDASGGNVEIINPEDLSRNLSQIVKKEILATQVSAKMFLHRGLRFKSDLSDDVKVRTDERIVGNVFEDSEIFFEFAVRSSQALEEFRNLSALPFQVQIRYVRKNGAKCIRIITKEKPITFEQEKAENEVDFSIVAANAMQQTASHASKGDVQGSRQISKMNKAFMQRVAKDKKQERVFNQYSEMFRELDEDEEAAPAVKSTPPSAPAPAAPSAFGFGYGAPAAFPAAYPAAPMAYSAASAAAVPSRFESDLFSALESKASVPAPSSASSRPKPRADMSEDAYASKVYKMKKANRSFFE